ncbi:CPBP family intramembrane metalloprotease [Candidatus Micrarchaeota archaeon]|nr:CPBP family intramembrane metalloprotease [Candidatus Micrarchaeota archaeon]
MPILFSFSQNAPSTAEQAFVPIIILLLPFFLLLVVEKKRFKEIPKNLYIRRPDIISGLKLFLLIFFILVVESLFLYLVGFLDTEKVSKVIAKQSMLFILLAIFASPIGEELLFRGYLQPKAEKSLKCVFSTLPLGSAAISITLVSVLFALLHYGYGSVSEIVGAFTFSVISGLWLNKEKNVVPCIMAHALFNSLAICIALKYV